MSGTHENRIAFITGANKGLGFETARQLGRLGITIVVGARDEERGQRAVEALRGEGIAAHRVLVDVTRDETIESAVGWIDRELGRLDILVNNAGVQVQRAAPSEVSVENLRRTFEPNFFGAFAVLQAALPLLRRAPAGRIVNVSSNVGSMFRLTDPDWELAERIYLGFAYSASKTALNVLTIAFAKELRGTAVKINSVCPGFTATDFNQHRGTRRPEDSVKLIVRYATLGPDGPSGGFFDEVGRIPW